jgi:hypothetical protein
VAEMRMSILIDLNAAKARAEAASMRDATLELGKAADVAGRGAQGAASGVSNLGTASGRSAAELTKAANSGTALTAVLGEMRGGLAAVDASLSQTETAMQRIIAASTGMANTARDSIAAELQRGAALDDLRAKFNPLFAASRQYELSLREIAEAERLGAISAMEAGQARQRAATMLLPVSGQMRTIGTDAQNANQYVGQLGFQANDIIMMMAAGQNPMMLALQQGTQITQVFDQMRLKGLAIGPALLGTFTSLLNPVNLITMGVIAATAATVAWFMEGDEAGGTFEDRLDALATATQTMRDVTGQSVDEMVAMYGTLTESVREAIRTQQEQALDTAKTESEKAVAGLNIDVADDVAMVIELRQQIEAIQGMEPSFLIGGREAQIEQINVLIANLEESAGLTEAQLVRVGAALDAFANASGIRAQADAMGAITAAIKGTSLETSDWGKQINAAQLKLYASADAADDLKREMAGASDEASILGVNSSDVLGWIDAIAGADISGPFRDAQGPAINLLNIANQIAARMNVLRYSPQQHFDQDNQVYSGRGGDPRQFDGSNGAFIPSAEVIAAADELLNPTPPIVSGGGGGGGGGRSAETNSVRDLIEAEQRELELLRELDPVKQELIRKSEQMADASPKEREEIEALIRARLAEKDAMEAVQRAQEELRSTMQSAFVGLVTDAHSFRDALGQVLGKLAELAANSAFDAIWNGNGSGAGNGRSGGLGGFLGNLVSGFFAEGGLVPGPGDPRADDRLVAVSANEYIVNAAATANNLPLLDAINAGVPVSDLMAAIGGQRPMGFADGGLVSGSGGGVSGLQSWAQGLGATADYSGGAGQSQIKVENHYHVNVYGGSGDDHIRELVADGLRAGMEMHDREVLPTRVQEIMSNERVLGA